MLSKIDPLFSTKLLDRVFRDPFLFDHPEFHSGLEYLKNEDGSLSICLDVPGIKEENLSVEASDDILIVKGERKTATSNLSLRKSFSIPAGFSVEDMKAELKDGVLTLTLAATCPQKTIKKIAVQSVK